MSAGPCRNLSPGTPRSGAGAGDAVGEFNLIKLLAVRGFFHEQIINLTEKLYFLQKADKTRIPKTRQTQFYVEPRTKNKMLIIFLKIDLKPMMTSRKR